MLETGESSEITEKKKGSGPKISPPESGADFNAVEDVVYRRRSVRKYRKEQVPEYLIRRILEAGRFAPSAGNGQTWKFIVLRDWNLIQEVTADVVEECRKVMKLFDYLEPGKEKRYRRVGFMQRIMTNMMHPIPYISAKLIAEGKLGLWHGAPTAILLLVDKRSPGDPLIDAGIVGQNMVLTAHSFGLGTCWVSFVKLIAKKRKWKKRLQIYHPYQLITSVAVGYPSGTPDGYVERETQAIDWYEREGMRVLY